MNGQTLWIIFCVLLVTIPTYRAIRKKIKHEQWKNSLTLEQRLLVEIKEGAFLTKVGRNLNASFVFLGWTLLFLYCLGQTQHF